MYVIYIDVYIYVCVHVCLPFYVSFSVLSFVFQKMSSYTYNLLDDILKGGKESLNLCFIFLDKLFVPQSSGQETC